MMEMQLSILVIGEDILKTNGEVSFMYENSSFFDTISRCLGNDSRELKVGNE